MNILQVSPYYFPHVGGVERHVQALSEQLVTLGHTVTVAAMRSRDEPSHEVIHGVQIQRLGALGVGNTYRLPVALIPFLLRTQTRFDVVHVHNYHAALFPLTGVVRAPAIVATPHFNDVPHSAIARVLHYPYMAAGEWTLRRARSVICVGEAERVRVESRLGVPGNRIVVIPNGIMTFRSSALPTVIKRDRHVLLVVSRLERYKGVHRVIDALTALPPPFRLVIVGEGPQRSALARRARTVGVANRIAFAGRVSDDELRDWYARAGVFVNLSTAEAFGLSVSEAVVAGCPVVCNDIPAFRDLADRFPDRLALVSSEDPAGLVRAIQEAAAEASDMPVTLPSEYGWDVIARRVLAVYERVIRQN